MKRVLIAFALAFAISGCASFVPGVPTLTSPAFLDDSDYARMEQADVSYACALKRMGIDEAPGPVPWLVWVDGSWINTYHTKAEWVESEYVEEINTIYIRRSMHAWRLLVWEMTLAVQYQLGEEYGEAEARKNASYAHHCVIFGEV